MLRIETERAGFFTFQLGVEPDAVKLPLIRIQDAYARFDSSPLAQVANQLEQEVVVSSIFGTNSIEGGTLSESETAMALRETEHSEISLPADVEKRRARNLKQAYQLAVDVAQTHNWTLNVAFICQLHAMVTEGLPHPYNRPGLLRDNPKGIHTHVGDSDHGGRYKPPQSGRDIERLLDALIDWYQQLCQAEVPVLLRAPLVHYYFERIHPFWDGNGRVGRIIEATLLQQAGYRYAPFALSRYYFEHIDRYFMLFNQCRKAENHHEPYPNTPFVVFFLEGFLDSINRLHDRVNQLVSILLFEMQLKRYLDEKVINPRQYAIVTQLMKEGAMSLRQLRAAPWYQALYMRLTDKTRQRDLHKLKALELIIQDQSDQIRPSIFLSQDG